MEDRELKTAFGTSSKAAECTWHKVQDVKAKPAADSTLFTAVHVVHQPEVVRTKSTRSPSTPPNS